MPGRTRNPDLVGASREPGTRNLEPGTWNPEPGIRNLKPESPIRKIIGIGNIYRRDDSVGVLVARRLAESGLQGVEIEEAGGEGVDLMDRWADADKVILIDATRSGAPPGTVHRLDASSETIPNSFFSYSTHAFSVAEAIELSRVLGQLPPEVLVFGIEGLDFSTGEGLTPPVAEVLDQVIELVIAEIH
ncbi:MAG: hydrogenase maturation protease [Rhodothermia bacterium]